jgi:hypothetical protein
MLSVEQLYSAIMKLRAIKDDSDFRESTQA